MTYEDDDPDNFYLFHRGKAKVGINRFVTQLT
jgi:hypothetical protein